MANVGAEGAIVSGLTDPDRFCAFYADALPCVYGYFFVRCGGHTSLVEDLTQETFLAAVAEINRGRQIAAPLPWVIGIARHKLVDHLRRQRRVGWSVISWEEDVGEETPTEEVDTISHERVVAALAAVPSPQRDALTLRYLDGLPVSEIAVVLGRSVEATESLLARGRVRFRRAHAEVCDGD